MTEVFTEFALLLVISAAAGMLANWIRQPVLIAYIVVGILVGPAVLGMVTHQDQISLLAQVGVAVLLFVVGLKLDLHLIRQFGKVALATGLGQISLTVVLGWILAWLLGRTPIESLYIGIALAFSSTIIIVKLLSDRRELDTLHGRMAVGILIVQDLAVVIAMLVMSTLRNETDAGLSTIGMELIVKVLVASAVLFVLMRFILPGVIKTVAKSQELLLVFAIAWGTGGAALGEFVGFSKEAGAFLAGFSLASTPYREAISARLLGIRDFLLLFFFIDLGAKLDLGLLGGQVPSALALSAFVLIGKPVIVMALMGLLGYRRRTSFLAGASLAQISEFSIIFVAMGAMLGHVGVDVLSLTTLVGVITIAISSYMIVYSRPLHDWLTPWLRIFERDRPYREGDSSSSVTSAAQPQVVVFGLGRYGLPLVKGLTAKGLPVMGVDYNPDVTEIFRNGTLPVRFGDGMDAAFLESLPLQEARWVISTFPDVESHRQLIRGLREHRFEGSIIVIARDELDVEPLQRCGADQVLYPLNDAVEHAVEILSSRITESDRR